MSMSIYNNTINHNFTLAPLCERIATPLLSCGTLKSLWNIAAAAQIKGLDCTNNNCTADYKGQTLTANYLQQGENGCIVSLLSKSKYENSQATLEYDGEKFSFDVVRKQLPQYFFSFLADGEVDISKARGSTDFKSFIRANWNVNDADSQSEGSLELNASNPKKTIFKFEKDNSALTGECQVGTNIISCDSEFLENKLDRLSGEKFRAVFSKNVVKHGVEKYKLDFEIPSYSDSSEIPHNVSMFNNLAILEADCGLNKTDDSLLGNCTLGWDGSSFLNAEFNVGKLADQKHLAFKIRQPDAKVFLNCDFKESASKYDATCEAGMTGMTIDIKFKDDDKVKGLLDRLKSLTIEFVEVVKTIKAEFHSEQTPEFNSLNLKVSDSVAGNLLEGAARLVNWKGFQAQVQAPLLDFRGNVTCDINEQAKNTFCTIFNNEEFRTGLGRLSQDGKQYSYKIFDGSAGKIVREKGGEVPEYIQNRINSNQNVGCVNNDEDREIVFNYV